MQVSQIDLIKFASIELWRMKKLAIILFMAISILLLAIGWSWPKNYASSATILVDEQNILTPLMEGTAIATSVKDHAKNAWQLLTGQYAKTQAIAFLGDKIEGLDDAEIDKEWEAIKYKTKVSKLGKNLINIKYHSKDPVEAQRYAEFFTDLFIDESVKSKRRESEAAYGFISSQASDYHEKLKKSEESLKLFRSANLGAAPGSSGTVNARILELQRATEEAQLEIAEIQIKLKNIQAQLSGEAEVSAHLTQEGQIQKRITILQGQLDTFRMTYLDTYPDIVILKDQISALRKQVLEVNNKDKKELIVTGALNPLFQELRSQFSKYSTQLASLKTRLKATKVLLEDEKVRAIQINSVDASMAQLTRDYNVNKELYQKLLRQRETARVSMNIDIANQGLTLKVQERAVVPSRPVGLRLMHFALIGLILGLIVPFGLMYMSVMFDGSVRAKQHFQNIIQAPVLGNISTYQNAASQAYLYKWVGIIAMAGLCVAVIYGYVAWLNFFL